MEAVETTERVTLEADFVFSALGRFGCTGLNVYRLVLPLFFTDGSHFAAQVELYETA